MRVMLPVIGTRNQVSLYETMLRKSIESDPVDFRISASGVFLLLRKSSCNIFQYLWMLLRNLNQGDCSAIGLFASLLPISECGHGNSQ